MLMEEKIFSLKTRYKIIAWSLLAVLLLVGFYFLDVTIQENASDELGHWCFIHCVLTGIFFLGATFLLVVMPQFIFFSIRFKGSEIFIKKTKDVYIIQRQMIDDISFGKDGCWLYLKDCRKFFIPKELNHFEEVKLRLKKLHKKDEGLIPYAGMKQVFGGKREKKR